MKVKGKLKFLLFIIVFFAFSVDQVKASVSGVVQDGEIDENIFSNIQTNIRLDIKESEFEKSEKIVQNKIIDELAKKDIIIRESTLEDFQAVKTFLGVSMTDNIRKIIASFNKQDGEIAELEISLEYSNSVQYNEEDKKYIEDIIAKINLPRDTEGDYIITKYLELGEEAPEFSGVIKNELKETINDDDIILLYKDGIGDTSMFSGESKVQFCVFKNDIYYADLFVNYKYQYEITIPDEVLDTEEAYIDYATSKVEAYINKMYRSGTYGSNYTNENYYLKKLNYNTYKIFNNKDESFNDETIVIRKSSTEKEQKNDSKNVSKNIDIIIIISVILIFVIVILTIFIKIK